MAGEPERLFEAIMMQFRESFVYRVYRFYLEGFRSMTLGRTLWAIILIKLFIMFVILKIFFFPNVLGKFDTQEERGAYVLEQWTERP